MDAGVSPTKPDAGIPPTKPDAGTPPTKPDAGTPPTKPDAGTPPTKPDAGTPPTKPDAGTPPTKPDAGTPPTKPDAGTPPTSDAGTCGVDTWNSYAGNFFASNCVSCHGEDLATYTNVSGSAKAITRAISSGQMPANKTLAAAEKARILAWLACGAPE